jgi:hypothetical protein
MKILRIVVLAMFLSTPLIIDHAQGDDQAQGELMSTVDVVRAHNRALEGTMVYSFECVVDGQIHAYTYEATEAYTFEDVFDMCMNITTMAENDGNRL